MSLELTIFADSRLFFAREFLDKNPVFMFEILSRPGFILQISPVSAPPPLTSPECLPEEIKIF